jgi:polysaccharide export outer membrane protein
MNGLAPLLKLILVLALAFSLSNCANSNQQNTPAATDAAATDAAASTLPTPAGVSSAAGDYRIARQDLLQVTVFQVPDLSGPVQVDGNGYISMPLIGRVEVGGKTVEQAQKEIATRLGKKYLQSPQVSVLVTKGGQRVTVNGAVGHPTVLAVSGKLTLSQAIAEAGGLSDVANSNRVHVARITGEHVKDTVFDLDAIQSGKQPDPSLYGGDIIVAESSDAKVAFKNVKDVLPFTVLFTLLH